MINNIQILRGLAALWVFFHHGFAHFKAMGLTFLPYEWIAMYGFAGVDVFFVISGLVMAKSTENLARGPVNGFKFLSKRYLRIYLGYWPIFIFSAWVIWLYQPVQFETVDLVGSTLLTNANMFQLLVPPAWSLPFELYFYSLVGLALILKFRTPNVLFFVLSIVIVGKLSLMDFGVSAVMDLLFSHMIFEFFMGYYLWVFRDQFFKVNSLVWLVVAVLSFYLASRFELVQTVWRALVYGVFSVALIVMAVRNEGRVYPWVIKTFKPIGDASYTLYLFHYIALFSFYEIGVRTYLVESGVASLGFILLILVVVVLSYLLYRLIEKPTYQLATKNIKLEKLDKQA